MNKRIIALLTVLAIGSTSVGYASESENEEQASPAEIVLSEEQTGVNQTDDDIENIFGTEPKNSLLKAEPAGISVGKEGANFEFEEIFTWAESYLIDDENASGGKYVRSGGVGSEIPYSGYTKEVKINVIDEGHYSVHFVSQMVRENLSSVTVTLDGVKIADNSNGTESNHFSTELEAINQTQGSKWLEDFWVETDLTAGEHTLVLTIARPEKTSNAIGFDNIYFYQPKEYTNISVDTKSYYTTGEEIALGIFDQDGILVDSRNYKSLELTTTTPQIIRISGNKVFARNHGKGQIHIVLKTDSQTFTRDIELNVSASNGLIIKSAKKEGTKVNVVLYATKDYTAGDNLSLISYNVSNGLKTLNVKSETKKIDNISNGQELIVEFDTAEWESYMLLNVYMHKSPIGQNFSIITSISDIK